MYIMYWKDNSKIDGYKYSYKHENRENKEHISCTNPKDSY